LIYKPADVTEHVAIGVVAEERHHIANVDKARLLSVDRRGDSAGFGVRCHGNTWRGSVEDGWVYVAVKRERKIDPNARPSRVGGMYACRPA
jgi:hypothetical protein